MGLTWTNGDRDVYLSYAGFGFYPFQEAVARLLGSTPSAIEQKVRNARGGVRKQKKGLVPVALLFLASESCDHFTAAQCRVLADWLGKLMADHPESHAALEWFASEFALAAQAGTGVGWG